MDEFGHFSDAAYGHSADWDQLMRAFDKDMVCVFIVPPGWKGPLPFYRTVPEDFELLQYGSDDYRSRVRYLANVMRYAHYVAGDDEHRQS